MVELSNAEEAWVVAENELRATKQELHDYKQKVSDTLREYIECFSTPAWHRLYEFILPEPKPDPLVEATLQVFPDNPFAKEHSDRIRAALDALGFEIREKNDG